jgi:hypothetical protein
VRLFLFRLISSLLVALLFAVLTGNQAEGKDVKQQLEEWEEIEGGPTGLEFWDKRAKLNVLAEFNYEYLDVHDIGDNDSGSRSNFFMSSLDVALRVLFNEWSKVDIVVAAEDVGKEGRSGNITLDEAIVTLEARSIPLYLIGGKTVMPFGGFEDHLIEGTLTEELFEINQVGATLGFEPDIYGVDISFSVYKDPQIIENLENFETHVSRNNRKNDDEFRSYIINVSLEPIEDALLLSTFFDSEPGDGKRNQSIGGALTWKYSDVSLDMEYITALDREKTANGEENKETVWVAGLAFQITNSLELATRYEKFDDGNSGNQDEVLDYSVRGGFNYSFLKFAIFSFEYRFSKYEKEKGSSAADEQNMFQFQLTLAF